VYVIRSIDGLGFKVFHQQVHWDMGEPIAAPISVSFNSTYLYLTPYINGII